MRTALRSLIVVLLLAHAALPCGAPQVIRGRVTVGSVPVYRAVVRIFADGSLVADQTALTGPFGYYSFEPVLPCSTYELRVSHKRLSFASVILTPASFPDDGSGLTVNFDGQFW